MSFSNSPGNTGNVSKSASLKSPPVNRVFLLQFIVAALLAGVAGLVNGSAAAVSAFAGALIAILPAAWFAWRAFRYTGTRYPGRVLAAFYGAEVGKLMLTAFLFAAVFRWLTPLHVPALFAGFIVVLLFGLGANAFLLRPAGSTH